MDQSNSQPPQEDIQSDTVIQNTPQSVNPPVMQPSPSSQISDPELKVYLEKVEKALLDDIVEQLKLKQITVEESQKTAKDFLSLLPPLDQNDLLKKLFSLSKKHPKEVLGVYLEFQEPVYKAEKDAALQKLAELIHAGNIDEALKVAKEENNAS